MKFKNPADRWGPVSQLLHWTIAALIVAISAIGLWMDTLPNTPRKIEVYALHKSIGITILVLALLRLVWRFYAGAPATLAGLPRWQVRTATLTHAALYALLFAMPLSGWLLNASAGYPLQWFGLFNLPRLIERDESLHELAQTLHEAGFWILLALVIAHAAAAFHHHLFRQDETLARMLPRSRRRGPLETPHGS
ncbi:cytochrome b [Lysobacter korlensis]|uniref:Cytochrome b n=1 Tax=Lysobacter korlensis TaxID=553636 RepID=A0ABV6S1L0_9GAMM